MDAKIQERTKLIDRLTDGDYVGSQSIKEEWISSIFGYSNQYLFDQTFLEALGDDWEGMFTVSGRWHFVAMKTELNERLKDWLKS